MDPSRTIAELKELHALTSDENGAQRVAFTPLWSQARGFLREKLRGLPVTTHDDAAGNFWATLPGRSEEALLIGGHMDSVPNGGWLDGCLNTLAGVEILRRLAEEHHGCPPVTVRLVDWADEEGARFGRSLFGSSACAGTLDIAEAARLHDREGGSLRDALLGVGIELDRVKESHAELASAAAYIELHIEQGPVLLDANQILGTVQGTFGVERHMLTFRGQPAHSGSTPMSRRRDAFLAAAKMGTEIYKIAARHGGVCTIGSCITRPGFATSVVGECRITLDQRHLDARLLKAMLQDAQEAARGVADEGGVSMEWELLQQIEPIPFHPELIELCDQATHDICGGAHRLPSGPLHDASEVSRAGIPTVMMFVQSLHGISHNKLEDTQEEHLAAALLAFDRLASKTLAWIKARPRQRQG